MAAAMITDRLPWAEAVSEADVWELYDASFGPHEPPAAVAATTPLAGATRVRLFAVVVAEAARGRGVGRRILEDLSDVLRARGVLALVAGVHSENEGAIRTLQRAGLQPGPGAPCSEGRDAPGLLWFHVDL